MNAARFIHGLEKDMAPKAKRARTKAPEPPAAIALYNLSWQGQVKLSHLATKRKRVLHVPMKALWAYILAKVHRQVQMKLQENRVQAENERRSTLQKLWLRSYQDAQNNLLNAFRNHKVAMTWFLTTLPKVRIAICREHDTGMKRLKTCLCGGLLTSNWDSAHDTCRACRLGAFSSSCSCACTAWEVLSCNKCIRPTRGPMPVPKSRSWTHTNQFTFAKHRWPLLWMSYQKSMAG